MIKQTGKYTALEILEEAGVPNAGAVIGTEAVVIGGISGIVKPDHLIRVAGDQPLDILVGDTPYQLDVEKPSKKELSEGVISNEAKKALDDKGKKILEQNEVHAARKELMVQREKLRKEGKIQDAAKLSAKIEKLGAPILKIK